MKAKGNKMPKPVTKTGSNRKGSSRYANTMRPTGKIR